MALLSIFVLTIPSTGPALALGSSPILDAADARIQEIRVDQPETGDPDEFFEISATTLEGLTYVVLGDVSTNGGIVEEIVDLDGQAVPPGGFFVVAQDTFSLGTADLTTALSFEDGDNVTHLLVSGFTGVGGQDLDLDDDGVLDTTPWSAVVDCVALIRTAGGGDPVYCDTTLGPLGLHAPYHAFRCGSRWEYGAEPVGIVDTPGAPGDCCRLDPACRYGEVDLSDETSTRASLHALIHDHAYVDFDNDQSWALLELADEYLADSSRSTILDIYKNAVYTKVESGRPYSREHTWPQDYGLSEALPTGAYPRSDHHALFLVDAGYNSSRSNLPYDTCTGCDARPTEHNNDQGGEEPPPAYPGDSNWRIGGETPAWETWTGSQGGRRGDVARALLYLDVRYDGSGHLDSTPEPDLVLTDQRELIQEDQPYMGVLSTLLAWHEQDPPDAQELWHHEVVSVFQWNRNPFVDHPDWVRCVFVEPCGLFADGFESGDLSAWSG